MSRHVWVKRWYSILWAPWRMKYIKQAGSREGCVFCEAPSMGDDAKALIVYRGSLSYVILNKYPYNSGHIMVTPYRHVAELEDLTMDEIMEMAKLVRASVKALKRVYAPHGFNIGVNIGEAAGAGIAGHFHIHVVPRWRGDSNFMLTVGGTKVIPESLEDTFKKLKPAVEEEARKEGV
ncbi:HIT family protein [Aeropyrum pernix]|nr:HIT domain-containing protein [Aeropyrum pernix]